MNWYIGQDIVAVMDQAQGVFKRGDEFKINGLRGSFCNCKIVLIDIGKVTGSKINRCPCCNIIDSSGGIAWYSEENFAPLDPIKEAISELMEQTQVTPAPIPHAVEI